MSIGSDVIGASVIGSSQFFVTLNPVPPTADNTVKAQREVRVKRVQLSEVEKVSETREVRA